MNTDLSSTLSIRENVVTSLAPGGGAYAHGLLDELLDPRRNEDLYLVVDGDPIYIGRVDGAGDVCLDDAMESMDDANEEAIAEALCRQLDSAESAEWNYEPENCPANFRRLYQSRRAAQGMSCEEYTLSCQFEASKGWDTEVSLADLLGSPEVSSDEYVLYRATDCIYLMGETIRIIDPDNDAETYSVTLV